jgi:hypothetical protein
MHEQLILFPVRRPIASIFSSNYPVFSANDGFVPLDGNKTG